MRTRTFGLLIGTLSLGLLAVPDAWAQGAPAARPAAVPAAPIPAPAAAAPRVQPAAQAPAAPVAPAAAAAVRAPAAAPGAAAAAPAAAPAGTSPTGFSERDLPSREPLVIEGIEPVAGGLTAEELARRMLAASSTVREKRTAVDAANEKINQTMLQFFPKLTLLASYTRVSPLTSGFGSGALVGAGSEGLLHVGACPPGAGTDCVVDAANNPVGAKAFAIKSLVNNYSLGARLNVPISDYIFRVSDAAASSTASRRSAELAMEAEKLKVQADGRALYFNWLRARAAVALAKKAVERTQARLGDARATFAVGAISKGDLLRIEAQVATTEVTLTRAQALLEFTAGQMAILTDDANPAYVVGEGVPVPEQIPDAPAPASQLMDEARTHRLEIASVDEAARGYRKGAGATRAGTLPRLDGVGDVTYANPNQRYFPPQQKWQATWSLGLQASWVVDDLFLNGAAARELEANAAGMEARKSSLRALVSTEVLSAYTDMARARVAYDKQRVALAAAEEAYRVTTDLFKAGRAITADIIDSETALLDAKLGDLNARIDLAIAAIQLNHVTGRDVPKDRS